MSEHGSEVAGMVQGDGTVGVETGIGTGVGTGGEVGIELGEVRRLWHLLEPLHAVLYYAPEVFEEAAALGYAGSAEDRWPTYFPFRAAPLASACRPPSTASARAWSPRTWTPLGTARAPRTC